MKFKIENEEDKRDLILKIMKLDVSKKHVGEIKPYKQIRSSNQNSLYFSWIRSASQQSGMPEDLLHELLKEEFLLGETYSLRGDSFSHKTTTGLKTDQFNKYLEQVFLWMSDRQITVYWPDTIYWDKYFEKNKKHIR